MLKKPQLFLFFLLLIPSCLINQHHSKLPEKKIELVLGQKIRDADKNQLITFWGICTNDLTSTDVELIELTGVLITNYYDNFFLGVGTANQIISLADYDFILSLGGSRSNKIRSTWKKSR